MWSELGTASLVTCSRNVFSTGLYVGNLRFWDALNATREHLMRMLSFVFHFLFQVLSHLYLYPPKQLSKLERPWARAVWLLLCSSCVPTTPGSQPSILTEILMACYYQLPSSVSLPATPGNFTSFGWSLVLPFHRGLGQGTCFHKSDLGARSLLVPVTSCSVLLPFSFPTSEPGKHILSFWDYILEIWMSQQAARFNTRNICACYLREISCSCFPGNQPVNRACLTPLLLK